MCPTEFPVIDDAVAEEYRSRALRGDAVGKACGSLISAEQKLAQEEFSLASVDAHDALQGFKAAGQQAERGDACRIAIKALIGQEKLDEALKLAKEELAAFRSAGHRAGEAQMLLSIADVQWPLKDEEGLPEAFRYAEDAQAIFRDLGNRKMEGIASATLTWVHLAKNEGGASEKALASAKHACALFQEVAHRGLEARGMHAVAAAHAAAGRLEESLRAADEALDTFLELKDQRLAAYEWLSMSATHLANGDHRRALADAEDALEAYAPFDSPREAQALMAIFRAHKQAGKPLGARRLIKEALARHEEAGNQRAEVAALQVLFQVYRHAGHMKEALRLGARTAEIYRDLGESALESRQLGSLAGLYFGAGEYEKALQVGEASEPTVRKKGTTTDKVELMQALIDSRVALDDLSRAEAIASNWLQHFQDVVDNEGRAAALMSTSALALKQGRLEETSRLASDAQVIYNEEEDAKGEAASLRMLCEVAMQREEYRMAVRAAEQARHLLRELGDKSGETSMTYLLAQSAVQLAVREGARVEESARAGKASKDALAKAAKAVVVAVKQARELPEGEHLLGCALCTLSQVEMLSGRSDEALVAADEGVVLFRNAADDSSEASALLLSADALRSSASYMEAQEAGKESLRLYQQCKNEKGQERAAELLKFLEPHFRPKPAAQAAGPPPPPGAPSMPGSMVNFADQAAPDQGQRVMVPRPAGPRGPALDLANIDEAAVQAKLLDIAVRVSGAEDGEIEADTPLMEAGLTSNSAILLRDELQQEMPGISLPVTLVFDYPSISAMMELVVEQSSKRLK